MLSYIPAICADITSKYHDDWLVDIMLIIYYVIKGHSAKDLFQVWLDNRILTKEEFQQVTSNNNTTNNTTTSGKFPPPQQQQSGPPNTTRTAPNATSNARAHPSLAPPVQKKGLLSKLLENEKSGSLRINGGKDIRKRNNRFGGIYHIKETVKPLDDDDDDDDDPSNQPKELDFLTNKTSTTTTASAITTETNTNQDANTSTESASPVATTDSKRPPLGTTAANRSTSGPAPLTKRIVYSYDNNPNAMRFPTAAAKRSKKNLLFAKVI